MSRQEEINKRERIHDSNCPHYKFLFEDVLHSSSADYYCTLDYQYDLLHGTPIDYAFCESGNYRNCHKFLVREGIRRKLYEEREEIVSSIGFTD